MPSSEKASLSLLSATLCFLSLPGCFAPLDLSNRRCPCDEGWTCDPGTDRCVQGAAGVDGGGPRVDAGPSLTDAAGIDAARIDGGAVDGRGRDASAVDAATPPDAATPIDAAPPPRDAGGFVWCPSTALVCDDFESSDIDRTPPWSWSEGGNIRVTDTFHRGRAAGRFFSAAGSRDHHQVGFTNPIPGTSDIWMRGHVRVAASISISDDVGVAVVRESISPYENTSLIFGSGGAGIYSTLADRGWGNLPIARDRWVCFVYHVHMASDGFASLELDGASLMTDRFDSRFAAGASVISAGITYVGPGQTAAFEVRYDDVAVTIDGTPLSCPP